MHVKKHDIEEQIGNLSLKNIIMLNNKDFRSETTTPIDRKNKQLSEDYYRKENAHNYNFNQRQISKRSNTSNLSVIKRD